MAGKDDSEKKDVPVSLTMPAPELDAVEEWMHAHRIRSRSYAVRCMIRFALAKGVEPDAEIDLRRRERARAKGE